MGYFKVGMGYLQPCILRYVTITGLFSTLLSHRNNYIVIPGGHAGCPARLPMNIFDAKSDDYFCIGASICPSLKLLSRGNNSLYYSTEHLHGKNYCPVGITIVPWNNTSISQE